MQPPYMLAHGLLSRILQKITEAQQPERFTQDFLGSKLGFESGSAKAAIPFLKRAGFLASDGTPTQLYSRYRNAGERPYAAAEAMKIAFKEIFERNEYANSLTKDRLRNLVVEITGLEPEQQIVGAIVGSFNALNAVANFEKREKDPVVAVTRSSAASAGEEDEMSSGPGPGQASERRVGLNLAYTINLNLPETRDVEVFNAIFRSLKENLLK